MAEGQIQSGGTGNTVMELIFLVSGTAHQKFPPSATGQRPPSPMARRQAASQECEQEPPLPPLSPGPSTPGAGCLEMTLPSLSLPGPDLPGKCPQGAWHSGVPPGCLAAPKSKRDCKELLLCMLFWSSEIPASLWYNMMWPKENLLAILIPTLNLSRCKLS